ncbi:MAG: agmatinase family protein [Armatimonadetes bacterium]|nr:agmatinase family protein [Armatimonadota bacterium]
MTMPASDALQPSFVILGVPFDGGASLGSPGSRYAPEEIRRAMRWMFQRAQQGRIFVLDIDRVIPFSPERVRDLGDVPVVAHDVAQMGERVTVRLREVFRGPEIPVVLGGDDSMTFPVIRALHEETRGELGLIHLDAHLDLLDESDLQGRLSQSSPIRRSLELGRLRGRRVIQIGVRNFNFPSSHDFIREQGITLLPAREFHRIGVEAAAARALEITRGAAAVHLALDVDVLDPAYAPGAGVAEPGGLTARQLFDFLWAVAPATRSISIVETNPLVDPRGQSVMVAAAAAMHYMVARFAAGASPGPGQSPGPG